MNAVTEISIVTRVRECRGFSRWTLVLACMFALSTAFSGGSALECWIVYRDRKAMDNTSTVSQVHWVPPVQNPLKMSMECILTSAKYGKAPSLCQGVHGYQVRHLGIEGIIKGQVSHFRAYLALKRA